MVYITFIVKAFSKFLNSEQQGFFFFALLPHLPNKGRAMISSTFVNNIHSLPCSILSIRLMRFLL